MVNLVEKYSKIKKYDADIYVIQECENPIKYKYAENYIWQGSLESKGIAVFAKTGITIEKLDWEDCDLKQFLPIRVNNDFTLLAVWTCKPYIEELAAYQDIHCGKFDKDIVVAGDFNANTCFDKKRSVEKGCCSFNNVVKRFNQAGLF